MGLLTYMGINTETRLNIFFLNIQRLKRLKLVVEASIGSVDLMLFKS